MKSQSKSAFQSNSTKKIVVKKKIYYMLKAFEHKAATISTWYGH